MATRGAILTKNAWADLGPTPCYLELQSPFPVRFVLAAAAPDTLDVAAHFLGLGSLDRFVQIAGLRVFARAHRDVEVLVVVSNLSGDVPASDSSSAYGLDLSQPLGVDLIPVA